MGGRVGFVFAQGCVDGFQNACEIAIDVTIPNLQDTEAGSAKFLVPIYIPCLMSIEIVLPAIDFDEKSMLETNEVHDVSLTRRLSPEMIATLSP